MTEKVVTIRNMENLLLGLLKGQQQINKRKKVGAITSWDMAPPNFKKQKIVEVYLIKHFYIYPNSEY